jgi:hypothetical protein
MFVSGSRLMLTALVLLGGVICSLTSVMMPISPTPPANRQNQASGYLAIAVGLHDATRLLDATISCTSCTAVLPIQLIYLPSNTNAGNGAALTHLMRASNRTSTATFAADAL